MSFPIPILVLVHRVLILELKTKFIRGRLNIR